MTFRLLITNIASFVDVRIYKVISARKWTDIPILFLLSPEVSGTSGTMSIYIYIYIYIYMSTTWRTRSRYVIFRLYFGKIHSFASDFISEESFRQEEFFEDDFQAIRVSRAVGGPRVF